MSKQVRQKRLCERFSLESNPNTVLKLTDLARAFEISERTINQDKAELEAKGAPFVYNGALRGWYFEHPFYLHEIQFTQDQLAHLYIGLELMDRLGILHNIPELKSISSNLNYRTRDSAVKAAQGKQIFIDPHPSQKGSDFLPLLIHAIEERRQIQFEYQSFHNPLSKLVIFDPYFLRFFDRRWYLGGYSHATDEKFVRTFPLDRIISKPEIIGFAMKKSADAMSEMYWQYIYGITITPDAAVEEINLKFTPIQGNYFINAPFFEPFKIVENTPQHIVISFKIMINIELIRKLASYGSDVKILKPDHLREKLSNFFLSALQNNL